VADYASEHLVADVMALADTLELPTFDLVGHDWGGMVAWLAATGHRERIRSLTVLSTPHPLALRLALFGGDADQLKRADATEALRQSAVPEKLLLGSDGSGSGLRELLVSTGLATEAIDTYLAALIQPGALTAALNWFRASDGDEVTQLPSVTVPTLYVWSTGDTGFGRAAAEATSIYVTGPYEFVVLDEVSHWIPETTPDQLNEKLLAHLSKT
jgi:pimeloyl-ACP methyl ester carboxylesterase